MSSPFLTLLNLTEQEQLTPPRELEQLQSVQDWVFKAFESIKDGLKEKDVAEFVGKALPWASLAAEIVPPVHFLFEVVKELTKVQEPEALAYLACTVAYQSSAAAAISAADLPSGNSIKARLGDSVDVTKHDFSYFTLHGALSHPFIRRADLVLEYYAVDSGFSERQTEQIVANVHDVFSDHLKKIITNGHDIEKFRPLITWLSLDSEGSAARAALRRHAQYSKWLFEEAPVLGYEPYALQHIYIDTGCGVLTRSEIEEKNADGFPKRDPFSLSKENGGIAPLLDQVLTFIRKPDFHDAIVIQGSAGSGKSSFTKLLATTLALEGLRPIRIRLRDVAIQKDFFTALGEAIAFEDENYLKANESWPRTTNILLNGDIFSDEVSYLGCRLCPYVLILDGWDEISLDVSEGFKLRVKELLRNVRHELFRRGPKVRVILTGRPSDAIDDSIDFFRRDTPILTVRPFSPDQFKDFAKKLRSALIDRPIAASAPSSWEMPSDEALARLFNAYYYSYESGKSDYKAAEIFGIPFLAQLAFRVIADPGADGDAVQKDDTTLLRRLTEIIVRDARFSSDQVDAARSSGNSFGDEIQQRISGDDLRNLLRQTAAKMTIAGRESLSRADLRSYLNTDDLDQRLNAAGVESILTALMISFYFKGGNSQLGCEFTHKVLREYLYAEAIVEVLKQFSAKYSRVPPLQERPLYWEEFSQSDPRRELVWELANLLSPQWLRPEPFRHLQSLLRWELERSVVRDQTVPRGATKPLPLPQWQFIRDNLADAWDWWAEGVHLRPQVETNPKSRNRLWAVPTAQSIIERNVALEHVGSLDGQVPPRLVSNDGHLGESLLRLCSLIHYYTGEQVRLAGMQDDIAPRPRGIYQSIKENIVRFKPGGASTEYFANYCARINATGWYPGRIFAQSAFLAGVDLQQVSCGRTHFRNSDLTSADLERADLRHADLTGAVLTKACLRGADLSGASLDGAALDLAVLEGAVMIRAQLRGASLSYAKLMHAKLSNADLSGADLQGAELDDADLSGAVMHKTSLSNAVLSNADLSAADLRDAVLTGTKFQFAQLMGADLRRAKLQGADFDGADLAGARILAEDMKSANLSKLQQRQVIT